MMRTCSEHSYRRADCTACDDANPPIATRSDVPAERLMSLKLRYALRSDEDRAPFRARSVTEILDEIIADVRGDVQT